MILAISNFKTNNLKKSVIKSNGRSYVSQINGSYSNADSFSNSNQSSKIAFTGKQYPSGYYEDDEIETAKRFIDQKTDEWKESLKKSTKKTNGDLFGESHGLWHSFRLLGGSKEDVEGLRFVGALGSLGITEILNGVGSLPEFAVRKGIDAKKAKKKVERIAKLVPDLIAENLQEQKKTLNSQNAKALEKVKFEENLDKLHVQLMESFSDRLDMEQKGAKADIPNCVMLIDEHDDLSKELIEWTGRNSDCNFIKLQNQDKNTLQDELWNTLNQAKEGFEKATMRRTLIHVDGFDELITPKSNAFENIEWLKDIMNRCAKDFGSTIIFKTKDISKLNNEAIQPQRVAAKILVAIKSFK